MRARFDDCFERRAPVALPAPSPDVPMGRFASFGWQSAHVHCLSASCAERPAHVACAQARHLQQDVLAP